MRFGRRRFVAACAACLGALFVLSSVQAFACPCEYKADKFPALTSKRPIPPAHAACLRSVSALQAYLRRAAGMAHREKARNAHQANLKRTYEIDWGVPPAEVARAMIASSRATVAKSEKTLKLERRKIGDPAHIQDIVADNIGLDESTIEHGTKLAEYARCVLKNNLPATVSGKD
jgi:hypothetical protein